MRKYNFVSYDSSNLSDDILWDYWERLHQMIDQENNKYEWNRVYMLKNVQDLTIMVDNKSNDIVGFYMGRFEHNKHTKHNKVSVAPKGRLGRNVRSTSNKPVAKGRNQHHNDESDNDSNKLTIDLIQAFDQKKGYGTLMLIHGAQKAGMKYHNINNLNKYIIINNPYDESIGFYERYELL